MHFFNSRNFSSSPTPRRRFLRLLTGIAAAALGRGAAAATREYQLKAVIILRLAQFVHWPEKAFESAESPLIIGILGQNPFAGSLKAAVEGETAHSRKILVQQLPALDNASTCHLLFIAGSERSRLREVLNTVRAAPVLTVSDIEGFALSGGAVALLMGENKVQMRVNLPVATAANLTFDARVLRLAEVIRG